jgi:hypothetical protein
MDSKEIEDTRSSSLQREIVILGNKKAEEYYSEAQQMAAWALESKLPPTQVSAMLSTINTTSSSAEFLNYIKKQVGKAHSSFTTSAKSAVKTPPAWIAAVHINQDSDEKKPFGAVLVDKLEGVRQQAIRDAERKEMDLENEIKLCVVYLRQFLKAFEAHYLYQSMEFSD